LCCFVEIQDDELWEFFKDCGKIESVRVIRDRDTGLGKGFGYVNFEEPASVELALKKEGTELKNRVVRISRCVKKLKSKDKDSGFISNAPKVKGEYGAFKRIKSKNRNDGGSVVGNDTQSNKRFSNPRNPKNNRKRLSQGERQRLEPFGGDRTAELGKLKVR
jgi:RNA recognition motif-containing protein